MEWIKKKKKFNGNCRANTKIKEEKEKKGKKKKLLVTNLYIHTSSLNKKCIWDAYKAISKQQFWPLESATRVNIYIYIFFIKILKWHKYPLTYELNYLILKTPRSFYCTTKIKITERPPS